MIVSIGIENLRAGHRLTIDGTVVGVPHELFTTAVIGSINIVRMRSLDQRVQVNIEGNTVFVDGDELELGASHNISIFEFHNKIVENPID